MYFSKSICQLYKDKFWRRWVRTLYMRMVRCTHKFSKVSDWRRTRHLRVSPLKINGKIGLQNFSILAAVIWNWTHPFHKKDFEIENKSLNGILQWSCVCRGPNWTLQFSILHRSWRYTKGVLFRVLQIVMIFYHLKESIAETTNAMH